MEYIIDNNVYFSLINPSSAVSGIVKKYGIRCLAPKFIKSELEEHEEECRMKSHLTKEEFLERKKEIEQEIEFFDVLEYKHFLKKATKLISDMDDVPYLALALKLRLPIWSNDTDIKKQSAIPVFKTREIIELLC